MTNDLDPVLILDRIRDDTDLISANVQYQLGIAVDTNQTLADIKPYLVEMHTWVSYTSCIILAMFLIIAIIAIPFIFRLGKIWR